MLHVGQFQVISAALLSARSSLCFFCVCLCVCVRVDAVNVSTTKFFGTDDGGFMLRFTHLENNEDVEKKQDTLYCIMHSEQLSVSRFTCRDKLFPRLIATLLHLRSWVFIFFLCHFVKDWLREQMSRLWLFLNEFNLMSDQNIGSMWGVPHSVVDCRVCNVLQLQHQLSFVRSIQYFNFLVSLCSLRDHFLSILQLKTAKYRSMGT